MVAPTPAQYTIAAQSLKRKIEAAYISIPDSGIIEALYQVGAERVSNNMRGDLEEALLNMGVRAYPALTTASEAYRLFHHDTVVASLVDLLMHPSEDSDKKLAEVVTKVKGLWSWAS